MSWFKEHLARVQANLQMKEVDLASLDRFSPPPLRTDLIGQFIMDDPGTVWQIIDGYARGFRGLYDFTSLHKWDEMGFVWKFHTEDDVKAWIVVGRPFMNPVLIRNPAGTVALQEEEDDLSHRRLRGFTSNNSFTLTYHCYPDNILDVTAAYYNSAEQGPPFPEPH
jgi:hypothetical protein